MEKKEERQKNAGLDNGRKVFARSKKPKVQRGEVKKVIENQDELDAQKYLGKTMA